MKQLTRLEQERIYLKSNLDLHNMKCKEVIDNCKNKFQEQNCSIEATMHLEELKNDECKIKTEMKENEKNLKKIQKIKMKNKKECKSIHHFYKKNQNQN